MYRASITINRLAGRRVDGLDRLVKDGAYQKKGAPTRERKRGEGGMRKMSARQKKIEGMKKEKKV